MISIVRLIATPGLNWVRSGRARARHIAYTSAIASAVIAEEKDNALILACFDDIGQTEAQTAVSPASFNNGQKI